MMIRIILTFLFLVNFLHADKYPKFFSKLGTPLYKAAEAFNQLSHLEGMEEKAHYYQTDVQHLLSVAKSVEADPKTKKEERREYVRRLRLLEKEHNEILFIINTSLLKSIDNDDYQTFSLIMKSDLDAILNNNVIRKRSMAYYVSNRTRGKIDKLDEIFSTIESNPSLLDYIQGHLPKVQYVKQVYTIDGPTQKLALSTNERFAYLASNRHCFKILDISNFSSSSELSSFEHPDQNCHLVNIKLSQDAKHTYLSDLNNGFYIIDISDPQSLIMEGEYPRIKALYSLVSKDDKTAFVVQKDRGFSILNISNKEEPRLLSNYNRGLKVSSLAYDENRSMLYVSHDKGLSLLDVSILGNPREILTFNVENGSSHVILSLKKKVAYLSSLAEGVHVLDISDDHNVSYISNYQTPKEAYHLTLSKDEDSLFISAMEDGVYHVDTKDLKDLRHRMSYKIDDKLSSEEDAAAYSSTLSTSQRHLYISYGKLGIAKVKLKTNY